MNDKEFQILCKKLDRIMAVLALNNFEKRDDKIAFLKKSGFNSVEIASFIGLDESSVRKSEGWKRK